MRARDMRARDMRARDIRQVHGRRLVQPRLRLEQQVSASCAHRRVVFRAAAICGGSASAIHADSPRLYRKQQRAHVRTQCESQRDRVDNRHIMELCPTMLLPRRVFRQALGFF